MDSGIRIEGVKRGARRHGKPAEKYRGSTTELHLELLSWSVGEEGGIPRVAVKCVDIRRNTSGEGGLLDDD